MLNEMEAVINCSKNWLLVCMFLGFINLLEWESQFLLDFIFLYRQT
jgi:hypothetical protein